MSAGAFRQFLFAFACVFFGLSLAPRGCGPWFARAHAALGNGFLPAGPTTTGVRLHFSATEEEVALEPWRATLHVDAPRDHLTMPIDLRSLAFLPLATFVALASAAPLGAWTRNARLLVVGLLLLEPLLLLLIALPVFLMLGGDGPIHVFELGTGARVALNVVYRALVAPPGMTYAIPLFLFLILLATMERRARDSEVGSMKTS